MATDFHLNVEAWHEEWLSGHERLAVEYFLYRYGEGAVDAMVVSDETNGDGPAYTCKGILKLPKGTSSLIFKMAKCCAADLAPPEAVRGFPFKFNRFPRSSFLLSMLLQVSFPRDTKTGIFHGNNGGIIIGFDSFEEIRESFGMRLAAHCAFAGLGVMLMRLCRSVVDPLITDEELIRRCERTYLCLFEARRP